MRKGQHCYIDVTGARFCYLIAEKFVECHKGEALWQCRCDCGNTINVTYSTLKRYQRKSCGCVSFNGTHKQSKTRLYKIWKAMRKRCSNPNDPVYRWYGQKGITVCNEWAKFVNFKNWAYENGYNDNLSIERKNPAWNYCPENCEWITRSENSKRAAAANPHKGGKHNLYKTKIYGFWQRWHNQMCQEWQDVTVFKRWSDEHGYKEGLCLIRHDYSKPISPSNCEFGTRKEQLQNIINNKRCLGIGFLQYKLKNYRKARKR